MVEGGRRFYENIGYLVAGESLSSDKERLAFLLLDIGAVRFGSFKLKLHDSHPDAPLSPIYIDLRILRRFPRSKRVAVDVYQELLAPLKFDLLADVPTAATPLVSSLSDRLGIPMVTPRVDVKSHGSGVKVDGLLFKDAGKVAVLIDDLVTQAGSKLSAAEILAEHGVSVHDVVVLVDRGQGGREQLESRGFCLHSALNMRQMLHFYLREGKMDWDLYWDVVQRLDLLDGFLKGV